MKISKNFAQKHIALDCEGRYWDWVDVSEGYDFWLKKLNEGWDKGWFDGVRIVERTFDEDTFTITITNVMNEVKGER